MASLENRSSLLLLAVGCVVFCLHITHTSAFRISQLLPQSDIGEEDQEYQPYDKRSWWSNEDTDDKRGGCHGFPCVFTHLGSKASDATIERIKMSILMDCLNDPHCFTQGRKKRLPPSQAVSGKLLFGKRFTSPLQWSGKRFIASPLQWSTSYKAPTYWKDRRHDGSAPFQGE